MTLSDTENGLLKLTSRADTVRACMLDPIASSFRGSGLGVLVALQFFDGADWQKGLLAAVSTVGMLLSPLAVSIARHVRAPVSRMAGCMVMLAAPGLIVASLAQSLFVFMVGVFLSVPLLGAAVPLGTAMWQQNAPGWLRGRAFSRVTFIGSCVAVASTLLISLWLGNEPGRYRPVTACFSVMVIVAGLALWRVPTRSLESRPRHHSGRVFGFFALLWQDRLFGYLCIAQMLVGFGNLATIPLRTEFLGSIERGMGYVAGVVYLITVVVPEVCRLVSIPMWGRLFDRLNFAILRMSVSSCFVVSLLCSFSSMLPLQLIGAMMFGVAMGGGAIAWALWVTKLAPAERTADYMAVHTFLTGVRGIVGPQLAFAALALWSIKTVGIIAAAIVLTSVLMLIPVIRIFRDRTHT